MKFKLETFPKDIIEKITNELSLIDVINLYKSDLSSNIMKICKRNDFWFHRFHKEFAFMIPQFADLSHTAKHRYLQVYFKISSHAKELVHTLLEVYGNFSKYLKKGYARDLYEHIHKRDISLLIHLIHNQNYIDDLEDLIDHLLDFDYLDNFNDIFPIKLEDDDFWNDFTNDYIIDFGISMSKYMNIISYDDDDSTEECVCDVF